MASKLSLEERKDMSCGNAMVAVAKALPSEERARANAGPSSTFAELDEQRDALSDLSLDEKEVTG
jgi:hypothetical protein